MHKIKDIISMPVLSLYEGELIGQVSKIYFDKKLKKVIYFTIASEGDLTYILYPKNVYKLGKNAITIKNMSCLILEIDTNTTDVVLMPLNSKTYTIQGEFIGKIEEITIDDKFYIKNILLDNNKFLNCNQLASCSKNTVIMYDENTKINVSRFKHRLTPNIFKSKSEVKNVSTMPYPPTIEESIEKITLPSNISNNPKFMIGRIATKDIMLDDKKFLIKANSTITDKTLNIATIHNKVKELMLCSKQK